MRASARRVRNVRVNAGAASLFQYAEPSDQTMRRGIPLRAPISASRRASGPVAGGATAAVASEGAVSFILLRHRWTPARSPGEWTEGRRALRRKAAHRMAVITAGGTSRAH